MRIGVLAWSGVFLAVLAWSAMVPRDWATWWLEVIPALAGAAILAATRRRHPLTPVAYVLVLIHAIILMVGGHYTYAQVPLGHWMSVALDLPRNDYDKIGHLAQGFVPAVLTREVLLRCAVLRRGPWLWLFVISFCLAVSAVYEMIEWGVAAASGRAAEAFLATQGYAWDTQSDMLCALIGATLALLLLSRIHDRQLRARAARTG